MNTFETKSVNHTFWLVTAIIIWTAVIVSSLLWIKHIESKQAIDLASNVAQAYFNKDKAIRLWSASHGGVYVPIDERTPPNPNLSNIPERDVITPQGKKLTLMNPAYMLSQMMSDYNDLYGVKGKITSFPSKLLNPNNSPDPWEVDALNAFTQGAAEVKEVVDVGGVPHLRLMSPLLITRDCLKCHASQGYKVGDLRGGVGVSVSMKPYMEAKQISLYHLYGIYSFFWLAGLVAFARLFVQARAREQDRKISEKQLLRLNRKLRRLSYVDGLTNVSNRRAFNKALDREWKRCRRDKQPLSLIMIDIDLFKEYNDHYGHQRGDQCLELVSKTLASVLKRSSDMVARYGGDEFILLLPETEFEPAVLLAEECRNRVLEQAIEFRVSPIAEFVSISLGVCTTMPTNDSEASTLLETADKALYKAKEKGRNRVEGAEI